jgi:hypothetical protein
MLQLLHFTKYVTDNFNERACSAAIFLEVSKACDTVWTTGVTCKLHTAGIPDSSLLLLALYITYRKFGVKIEGKLSKWKPIRAGVHQGTVLDP